MQAEARTMVVTRHPKRKEKEEGERGKRRGRGRRRRRRRRRRVCWKRVDQRVESTTVRWMSSNPPTWTWVGKQTPLQYSKLELVLTVMLATRKGCVQPLPLLCRALMLDVVPWLV